METISNKIQNKICKWKQNIWESHQKNPSWNNTCWLVHLKCWLLPFSHFLLHFFPFMENRFFFSNNLSWLLIPLLLSSQFLPASLPIQNHPLSASHKKTNRLRSDSNKKENVPIELACTQVCVTLSWLMTDLGASSILRVVPHPSAVGPGYYQQTE